jgi:uncharacterized protein YecE (DUF72 family)
MKVLAGTSGFAFKEWKGPFYPADLSDKRMLEFYATRFPTVEINNTFYRMPKADVLADWAARVPAQFAFSIKASQRITHFGRLKPDSYQHVDYLVKTAGVLGGRLGPLLFQLPPNLKRDTALLHDFLECLPAGQKYAMEFRHPSWFDDAVLTDLRDHDVALSIIEQEDFAAPVVTTASWSYLRLHKLDYDSAQLEEWAARVHDLGCEQAYVYFKHDEGVGSGPNAVDRFAIACRALNQV